MTTYLLDTNILIRHLRQDDLDQSPKATALFKAAGDGRCDVLLTPAVICETFWVFRSHYAVEHKAITDQLAALILSRGVRCEQEGRVLDALARCGATRLDIVDCLLAAQSVADQINLATFDRAIGKRFPDTELWDQAGG